MNGHIKMHDICSVTIVIKPTPITQHDTVCLTYLLHLLLAQTANSAFHLSEYIGYENVADLLLQLSLWKEWREERCEPPGTAGQPLGYRGE